MFYYFTYFGLAFFTSFTLLIPFRRTAIYCHVVSSPKKGSLPYLGGGPLYFSFVFSLFIFFLWKNFDPNFPITIENEKLLSILIGAALLAFTGLIRDVYPHSTLISLSCQIVVGFLLFRGGIKTDITWLNIFPVNLENQTIYLGNFFLTVFWLITLTNVVDWLDSQEGIALGIPSLIISFLFILAIIQQNHTQAFLCAVMGGSFLGGMIEQMPPRRTFLGRMGSHFIGFCLTFLTLEGYYSNHFSISIVSPIVLMGSFWVALILSLVHFSKTRKFSIGKTIQKVKWSSGETLSHSLLLTSLFGLLALGIALLDSIFLIYSCLGSAIGLFFFALFYFQRALTPRKTS